MILPVLVYGCEIWYLTLMEERRLKIFENGVQWGIFEPEGIRMGTEGGFKMRKLII